jgi:hypothetical protein
MGIARQIGQWRRSEKAKTRGYKLSKELQLWYGNHYVSPWQQGKINEIRALYEKRQQDLARAHDYSASRLSEEFMQFELDYLFTSDKFKADNPGKEWAPTGVRGIFYKAFWKNLMKKADALGITLHGKTEAAK